MAEARNGAESSAPAVETDAVSMNCRLDSRNKRDPSFRKGSSFAATALAWLGAAAERRNWGRRVESGTLAVPSTKASLGSALHRELTSV